MNDNYVELIAEEDIEKYLGVSVLAKVPDRKDYVNMKNKKSKEQ